MGLFLAPLVFQLPIAVLESVEVARATEEGNIETRTASLLRGLAAAMSSNRFQFDNRLSAISFSLASSSLNLARH